MPFPSPVTPLTLGVIWALALATPVGVSPLVAQQTPDAASAVTIELEFDAARVDGLFATNATVPPERLLGEALSLRSADGAGRVVLISYRIRNGLIEAGFESPVFDSPGAAGAALADAGAALPGTDFFEGVGPVEPGGVADANWTVDATSGAGNPLRYVASQTAGKPADWTDRAVVYAVVVPADRADRAAASVIPAVMFGEADARFGSTSTTTPSGSTPATTATGLLRQAHELEQARNAWVQDYTLYRQVEGMVVPVYFERDPAFSPLAVAGGGAPAVGAQGETGFRMVSPPQYIERWHEQAGMPTPEPTDEMASAYDMTGAAMNQALSAEGVPAVGDAAEGMFNMMGMFIRAAAAVDPDSLMPQDLEADVAAVQEFGRRARILGVETVRGRRAHHLRATGLEDIRLEQGSGPPVTLKAASLWLDERHLVPVRLVFETEVVEKGKPQPIEISLAIPKYAWTGAPGSSMLLPAVERMAITGLDQAMSEKERAEMQKALADAEEMKAEMEKMPAAVRKMMQGRIDRLEKMAGTGGSSVFKSVVPTIHAAVNEGPPYPGGVGSFSIGGKYFPGAIVVATWQFADWYYGFGNLIYLVPASLAFRGGIGGVEGWLELSDLAYSSDVNDGSPSIARVGKARGGIRLGDGTETQFSYEGAGIILWKLMTTEVGGEVRFDGGQAAFMAGHMPCSGEPRAISMEPRLTDDFQKRVEAKAAELKKLEQQGSLPDDPWGEFQACHDAIVDAMRRAGAGEP